MKKKYFFGIKNQQVGPLDADLIKKHIVEGAITEDTLAWCKGMKTWQPVRNIPELVETFGALLDEHIKPPPLPKTPLPEKPPVPPPLPKSPEVRTAGVVPEKPAAATENQDDGEPEGLSPLHQNAYRFVTWCFRRGKGRSVILDYVDKDPRRALSVAVLTVFCLTTLLLFSVTVVMESVEEGQDYERMPVLQQGGAPQGSGDWQRRYQIWQEQQRDSQRVMDDVYQYKRDSQDRMDETYRRANYDWYQDKND